MASTRLAVRAVARHETSLQEAIPPNNNNDSNNNNSNSWSFISVKL